LQNYLGDTGEKIKQITAFKYNRLQTRESLIALVGIAYILMELITNAFQIQYQDIA